MYLHLLRLGYTVHVGQLRNAEIDFVAEKGEQTLYIQVAYLIADEETEKREFSYQKQPSEDGHFNESAQFYL